MVASSPAGPGRLLVVSSYFDTHKGGLEIVAGRLADELAQRDFEVSWLATNAMTPAPSPRVTPIPVGAWNFSERRLGIPFPIPSPAALARLFEAVREADAVLLHDALYPLSMATTLAARMSGTPLVIIQHIGAVKYHNPIPRLLMAVANRVVARPVLAAADQVVFISHFVREFFASVRYRRPPEIVFNGVDTEVFAIGDRAAARAALDLPKDAKVALFVGRFVEKKGLHLLRAAAMARPEITFAFAGWGHIEPAGWGLANVRAFSGKSGRELAQLYQAADAFVLPSVGEGFPLVIQEALACGLPVICGTETTTADPGAAAVLTGVDVEGPDAVGELITAIDVELAARHTPKAAQARRELVMARYAWSASADRYATILQGLIAAKRPARASTNLAGATR